MKFVYENILNKITNAIYFLDLDGNVSFWNRSAENLTGFTKEEALNVKLNHNIIMFIDENGDEFSFDYNCLSTNEEITIPYLYLHHKDGYRLSVTVKFSNMLNEDGKVVGHVGIFDKNSCADKIVKEMELIRHETLTDKVTGVGTKECAKIILNSRFEELDRFGINFGVLLFDIDDFKVVNDQFSWDVGDQAARMVTQSATSVLRNTDSVCRWGVDEFIAIIPDTDVKELKVIGERIRKFVELSWFKHNNDKVSVTVFVGGVLAKKNETVESLIYRADKIRLKCGSNDCANTVTVK